MDIYAYLQPTPLFSKPHEQCFSRLRDVVQALEEMGVTGVCFGDHIVHYGWELADHRAMDGRHPDIFTLLATVAALTTRLRIVSRIVVLPYRQPFATAHMIATLDVMSQGRVSFGSAPGYAPVEFETFGIPIKERGARTDEYLKIIIALLSQDKITFEGRFYSARDIGLLMRPLQTPHPPIWIGGFSHRAVERAVEFGDVWTPNAYTYPPDKPGARNSLSIEEFRDEMAWAHNACAERGRKPLKSVLSAGPVLDFSDTRIHPGRTRGDIRHFTGEGTPDELADEFLAFRDAGADAFYVSFSGDTPDRYLHNARRFMTEIAPRLA